MTTRATADERFRQRVEALERVSMALGPQSLFQLAKCLGANDRTLRQTLDSGGLGEGQYERTPSTRVSRAEIISRFDDVLPDLQPSQVAEILRRVADELEVDEIKRLRGSRDLGGL
jgi:hypothetical protein